MNADLPVKKDARSGHRRVAFYGGSFDPVHNGHLSIARDLSEMFAFDNFWFVPAFHAPHKVRARPTSAYDRFAMLCLITRDSARISVSKMEIESPERPFTFETLTALNKHLDPNEIFFVMGADSWMEITTWRNWQEVLGLSNHIVMTRPGISISDGHVTPEIRSRIVDLSGLGPADSSKITAGLSKTGETTIYFTDSVNISISATAIRKKIRNSDSDWKSDVPEEVAKYIEKYQIYT
jgi:nicotinate-nucleotide adenylyltransferase